MGGQRNLLIEIDEQRVVAGGSKYRRTVCKCETGLHLCPPEKKARKLAREIQWNTFSGPV
jgi:hypothetical protein